MAWIVYIAYGKSSIVEAATDDPVGLVFAATEQYVGHGAVVDDGIPAGTSAFASTLAFHDTAPVPRPHSRAGACFPVLAA